MNPRTSGYPLLLAALLLTAPTQGGTESMKTEEQPGLVTMKGRPVTLLGPVLETGAVAPDFQVVDGSFTPVKLSDFKGKVVLISAVPSLDTGVCSLQTKHFNQEAAHLPDEVVVVTISMDLPFAQKRFCEAEKVTAIRVLSDVAWRDFGARYGLIIKDMGLLARAVFVIDRDGRVCYRQLVPEIATEPDYAAALAAARAAAALAPASRQKW